jgi:hypothetical protein
MRRHERESASSCPDRHPSKTIPPRAEQFYLRRLRISPLTIAPATRDTSGTITVPSLLVFWMWMSWTRVVARRRTPQISVAS